MTNVRSVRFLFCALMMLIAISTFAQLPYTSYQTASQYFDGEANMGPFAWRDPATLGGNFSRAVAGGQEGSTTLYVCRALVDNTKGGVEYHPGKYFAGKCNIGWGGQELVVGGGVQVLVNALNGTDQQAALFTPSWVAPNDASPGFNGGGASTTKLRVCQAAFNKGVHPGKEWANNCNIGWGGKEFAVPAYQVLSLYNGAKLTAAVTQLVVPLTEGSPGTLEFVTMVAYPGKLTVQSLQPPYQTYQVLSVKSADVSCPNTPGSNCKQRFTWSIGMGKNSAFGAGWTANFNKTCADGSACGAGQHSVVTQ